MSRCRRTPCPSPCSAPASCGSGGSGFNAGSALAANGIAVQALHQHDPRRRGGDARRGSSSRSSSTGTSPPSAPPRAAWPAWWPSPRARGSSAAWPRSTSASVAGVVCYLAVGLKTKAGYDDALDVIGVHLVGGLVGSLLLGLVRRPGDFNPAWSTPACSSRTAARSCLVDQALAIGVTIVYAFVVSFIIAGDRGDHRRASLERGRAAAASACEHLSRLPLPRRHTRT